MATEKVLKIKVDAETRKALKGMKDLQGQTKKSTAGFKALGGTIAKFAGAAVLAKGFTSLISTTAKFEKGFANVTTLLDKSTDDFEALRKGVLGMAGELGSATELTDGLYQALSAGVEPAKAIKFVGESAKFAKAALVDTLTSVDILTTALNAYGMEANKAGHVSDVLFQIIKDGKTTGQELASSLGNVIPIANEMGVSLEELGGALAIMTKQGIKTDQAVTSLKQVFAGVMAATPEVIAKADKIGIAFTKLGIKNAGGLQKWLIKVKEAMDKNGMAANQLFPNIKALEGVLALTGSQAEAYAEQMTKMADVAGNTDEAFKKQIGTFDEMWKAVKNKLTASLIDSFLPVLEDIKDVISSPEFTEGVNNFAAGISKIAKAAQEGSKFIAKFGRDLGTSFADATMGKDTSNILSGVKGQFQDLLVSVMATRRAFGKGAEEFTNFDRVMVALRNSTGTYEEKMIKLRKIIKDFSGTNTEFAKTYKEIRTGQKEVTEETDELTGKIKGLGEETKGTGEETKKTGGEFTKLSNVSTDLIGKIQQLSWWMDQTGQSHKSADKAVKEMSDSLMAESESAHDASDGIEFFIEATDDATESAEGFGGGLGSLVGNLNNVFGALTSLGGPIGNVAGGLSGLAGNVGNLIAGIGGGFGLANLPGIIGAGIGAFNSLKSVLGAVGSAIGGFFDMWGDSEWKKLLRSTDDETEAIWDMVNTLGMTPGVIDIIKKRLDSLPAGFEATRRGLEQLLIDAGAAEAGMRGLAGRPELESDAGDFKNQTDTPVSGDKNSFNPDGDFMSAASGFNGVLKRDTLIQAHKGEPVSITPKGQAGKGMGGGDKIDNRRQVFNFNNELILTESSILQMWKRAFRTDREGIKRVTKSELGLT